MNLGSSERYTRDLRKYYRLPAVQVSLTLVLSFFVMAMFIVLALRPTMVSIVSLKKNIEESKSTLTKLDAKVVSLQKVSSQFEKIKPMLQVLNTDIPNKSADYSPLSVSIESLASQTGTLLESESLGPTLLFSRLFSPFTPNKNQIVVTLPFAVRVTGSYSAVSSFLEKILSMERIIMVETITITQEATSKTTTPNVALNINGTAFYLADSLQLEKATTEVKGRK